MSRDQLPVYRHFPGNPIARPPCRMLGANMYGFFLAADETAVQHYIDLTLNALATDSVRFKALSSYLLLTFTDIENIASKTPPYSSHGWMQETDIIVWLPVAKMVRAGGAEKAQHIYWYPAFICVNNIYALINGRETWGYNKYLCEYTMPARGEAARYFSLTLDTFAAYSPDTPLSPHLLLEVTRTNPQPETLLEHGVDLAREVAALLHGGLAIAELDLPVLGQMLSGFIHPAMDQILFKQFPDGSGEHAVYRAVMHSPSEIKKIHHLSLLRDEFEVNIRPNASFPLAEMFGLKNGPQSALLPFNVLMDFDQQAACELRTEVSHG